MEEQIQDLIEKSGEIAISGVPVPNWKSIKVLVSAVEGYIMLRAWYTLEGQEYPLMFDFDGDEEFEELRMQMAKSEEQIWYNATLEIDSDGGFDIDFDYENPPQIEPFPSDYWFIDEYKKYPRSKGELPNWLQDILMRNNDI